MGLGARWHACVGGGCHGHYCVFRGRLSRGLLVPPVLVGCTNTMAKGGGKGNGVDGERRAGWFGMFGIEG